MSRFLIAVSLASLPFRVIMPGEEHWARWIRAVQRLRLVLGGT